MTISEFIYNEENKAFHMSDCFYKEILDGYGTPQLILSSGVLDRFHGVLEEAKCRFTVTPKERIRYMYNPKKLSADCYGTTEYWFLVLHANELFSASQFDMARDDMYLYVQDVNRVINEIINVEKTYIRDNASVISSYKTSGVIVPHQ